jgi:hypothetical protein
MHDTKLTRRVEKRGYKTALAAVKNTQVNKSHPNSRLSPCAIPRIYKNRATICYKYTNFGFNNDTIDDHR